MQAQATMPTRRPVFDRVSASLLALGLVAGIAVGAIGQAVVDDSDGATRRAIVSAPVTAHTGEGQGEGRIGGAHTLTEPLKGHTSSNQGEGLINPDLRVATSAQSADRMRFLEINLYLPEVTTDDATMSKQMIYKRLLEENYDILPAVVPDAPNWRVLEENSWGEDFDLDGSDAPDGGTYYPMPDEVQPHPGAVIF